MDTFKRECLRELIKELFRELNKEMDIKTCETTLDNKVKLITDYDLEQIVAEALHYYMTYKEAGLI